MGWGLGYEHDENGNRVSGSKSDLVAAVRNGRPVRVLMDSGDGQLVVDAETLWVWRENVYAQNTSTVSAIFQGAQRTFLDDSFWSMIIVDTQGERDKIGWNVGEHKSRGHSRDRIAMKWFFFDPSRFR